eukprot:980044-Pleurochrysis_carterae.AAC.2
MPLPETTPPPAQVEVFTLSDVDVRELLEALLYEEGSYNTAIAHSKHEINVCAASSLMSGDKSYSRLLRTTRHMESVRPKFTKTV